MSASFVPSAHVFMLISNATFSVTFYHAKLDAFEYFFIRKLLKYMMYIILPSALTALILWLQV